MNALHSRTLARKEVPHASGSVPQREPAIPIAAAIAPPVCLPAQTLYQGEHSHGTAKSHLLLGLGQAAVATGRRVRYFVAAALIETLYRGLADNSVGRVIDQLLRCDLIIIDELGFAPLDAVGSQLLFRFVAAAYERRSLGVASHWPFDQWGRFLPEQATAVSLIDRLLHHAVTVVTDGDSFRMREARSRPRPGGAPM